MRPSTRPALAPGQEWAWDYPRPPRIDPSGRHVRVIASGIVIAATSRAIRVLETSHPPAWYLPPDDVRVDLMVPSRTTSWCEFKGAATYRSLHLPDGVRADVAWAYEDPTPPFEAIRGHLAFYPGRVDACWVDAELVTPQAGGFYGGWITSDVVGPFKGEAGSRGW